MKKLILLPLLLAGILANAQTEKGTLMVGAGILNAGGNFQNGNNAIGLTINPRAGLFVADKLAIGATVLLGASHFNHTTNFSYGLSPFARYYFTNKKTAFFLEGGVGLTGYHIAGKEYTGIRNGQHFIFDFGPGITHFIAPNVAVEGLLQLRGNKALQGSSPFNIQPGLNIGFQIYLKKKAKSATEPLPEQ